MAPPINGTWQTVHQNKFNNQSILDSTWSYTHWNFGDGDTSNLLNPTHTYTNNGTYVVCLTIYHPKILSSKHNSLHFQFHFLLKLLHHFLKMIWSGCKEIHQQLPLLP